MFDSSGFEGLPRSAGRARPEPDHHPVDSPPTGANHVATLARTHLGALDEDGLLDTLVEWERAASWVAARQHEVIQELLGRARGSMARDGVIAEVGASLAISPRAAQTRVGTAEALAVFPRLHRSMRDGTLDPRRVETILSHTDHLPAERAAAVIDQVVPEAPDMPLPRLRRAVRAAELAQDPGACRAAQDRAVGDRAVRMTPAPDGMARVQAYLPAVGAVTVMTALTALAAAQSSDDPRGYDARRADALVDLCRDVLDRGVDPTGEPLPTRHRRHPHITLTATAATANGVRDTPAWLGGYGLITADLAREVMADAPRHVVLADTTGRLIARTATAYRPGPVLTDLVTQRDRTCTFPGCGTLATASDLDHIQPYVPDREQRHPQTDLENLHALCRHHHRLKTHAGWTPTRHPSDGSTTWASPARRRYLRLAEPALPDDLTLPCEAAPPCETPPPYETAPLDDTGHQGEPRSTGPPEPSGDTDPPPF